MKQLMISLDKQIADPYSRVAERMIGYGEFHELHILIPDTEAKKEFSLSTDVWVEKTGGFKLFQFFRLFTRGSSLIRKYDIRFITTQDPFFTGFVGLLLRMRRRRKFKKKSEKRQVKLEVQLHGDFYGSDYYKKKAGLKAFFQYWLGRLVVLRCADKIRVVSRRIKNSLIEMGIPKSKIRVRPIAVTLKNFTPVLGRSTLKSRYNFDKVFLWVGRMEPVKNLFFLIDIFEQVVEEKPTWGLVLLGNGSEEKELQKKVKELELEFNIRFEPWAHDPTDYFKSADCFLFPSHNEGYGLVIKEAISADLPVIMNDVGIAQYEVKASDKVKILPVNDEEKWIQALLSI